MDSKSSRLKILAIFFGDSFSGFEQLVHQIDVNFCEMVHSSLQHPLSLFQIPESPPGCPLEMEEIFPMLFQAGPDRSISPHQSWLRTSKRCQETPNLPVSLGWSHVGPGRGRAVGIPLVHISLGALAADGAAGGPYAKPLRGTDAVESVTTFWESKDRTLSYLALANYTTHHIRLKA